MGNKKLLESTQMICEIDGSKAHDNRLTSFLGWIRDLVKDGSRLNVRRKRINLGGRGACTPRKPGEALEEMIVGSFMPLNQFISVLSYFNIHYVQYSFSVVSTRAKPLLDLLQRSL